ncbi:hypothetical protein PORY_002599 [Pneumocystis oryctolagi]|uniref:Uncharacterized protein n=1 Tax=Pneumocystis oryctolagi TaxID=42067 RepID=A0ACB7C8I0_9ASCO|nr:hypothetical protein PORY_002599 [Pneumocystis oryctolagi]
MIEMYSMSFHQNTRELSESRNSNIEYFNIENINNSSTSALILDVSKLDLLLDKMVQMTDLLPQHPPLHRNTRPLQPIHPHRPSFI